MSLPELVATVRACTLCADTLEPRPVLRVAAESRVLVIGQAPGSKVHASGKPWADRSGATLIEWLGVDRATFDDPSRFGILPMGFCYPGRGKSGDLPPPPICAETWHPPLLDALSQRRLVLLVGQYAQARYLGARRKKTLTETVRAFEEVGPEFFPLPHPSWRSRIFMTRNPWFAEEVLPRLQQRVADALTPLA